MGTVILAIGLVMIVEGAAYALSPALVARMLEMLRTLPESAVRQVGLLSVVSGLILVWIAVRLGAM